MGSCRDQPSGMASGIMYKRFRMPPLTAGKLAHFALEERVTAGEKSALKGADLRHEIGG